MSNLFMTVESMLSISEDAVLNAELQKSPESSFEAETDFWLAVELKFCVAALHVAALQSLSTASVGRNGSACAATGSNGRRCSPSDLAARVRELAAVRDNLKACMQARLAVSSKLPLAIQLARAYRLSEVELDVFLLLVLIQSGHRSDTFTAVCLAEVDEGVGDATLVRKLCRMSALQLSAFLDEERLHVKDGIVVPKDDDYASARCFSVSAEACEVRCGSRRLRSHSSRSQSLL